MTKRIAGKTARQYTIARIARMAGSATDGAIFEAMSELSYTARPGTNDAAAVEYINETEARGGGSWGGLMAAIRAAARN